MEEAPLEPASSSESTWNTQYTPPTTVCPCNGNEHAALLSMPIPSLNVGDVPWHDKNFLILEQSTRKALTHAEHGVRVMSLDDNGVDSRNMWLCVHKNNYVGFMNKHTRCFLSHDGGSVITAWGPEMKPWECFMPRILPDGGYHILSPFYHAEMRMLVVVGEEGRVERTNHGGTTWVFEEV